MDNLPLYITLSVFSVGILGAFIWVALVIYLKIKWLEQLEDIMDDGISLLKIQASEMYSN